MLGVFFCTVDMSCFSVSNNSNAKGGSERKFLLPSKALQPEF